MKKITLLVILFIPLASYGHGGSYKPNSGKLIVPNIYQFSCMHTKSKITCKGNYDSKLGWNDWACSDGYIVDFNPSSIIVPGIHKVPGGGKELQFDSLKIARNLMGDNDCHERH